MAVILYGTDSPLFRRETLEAKIARFAINRGMVEIDGDGKRIVGKKAVKGFINWYNDKHDKFFTKIENVKFPNSSQEYLRLK